MSKKKIFSSFLAFSFMLIMGAVFVGCGNKNEIVKIEIDGKNEITVVQSEAFDLKANVKVNAVYSDDTKKAISNDELTFSTDSIDTNIIANNVVTISYNNKFTTTITIKVIDKEDTLIVMGFKNPKFVTDLDTNKKQNTYTGYGSNGNKGFTDIDNLYLVGDDNPFKYNPEITLSDGRNVTSNYRANFKLSLKDGTNFVELKDEELTSYASIDKVNFQVDFTEKAIGNEFKLEVMPNYEFSPVFEGEVKSSFEFKVVDGYNVYNADDLSVIDNTNASGKWTELKTTNNISLDLDVNAVVLHSNIIIEAKNLPKVHFWQEDEVKNALDYKRALGSLKDSTKEDLGYIYNHKIKDGQTFKIEGNYFKLSAENIKPIVRQDEKSVSKEGDTIVSHTSLFKFYGDYNKTEETKPVETLELNNLQLFGNSKKSEDVTKSGGVIFGKFNNVDTKIYNNFAQSWFITYMFEGTQNYDIKNEIKNTSELNKVNAFDAYNTILYLWGCPQLNIVDSILVGAGGPIMICDHVMQDGQTDPKTGYPSNVLVTNSTLESFVAGTEGWFTSFKATALAGLIKTMNQLMTPYGKTFLRKSIQDNSTDLFNLVAVFKSGSAEAATNQAIAGTFNDSDFLPKEGEKYKSGLDLLEFSELGKNKLQTYNRNMEGSIGTVGDAGWTETPEKQERIFTAERYLNIYLYNGMGGILGLNNLAK